MISGEEKRRKKTRGKTTRPEDEFIVDSKIRGIQIVLLTLIIWSVGTLKTDG